MLRFKSGSPCLSEIQSEIFTDKVIWLIHFKIIQGWGKVCRGTNATTLAMSWKLLGWVVCRWRFVILFSLFLYTFDIFHNFPLLPHFPASPFPPQAAHSQTRHQTRPSAMPALNLGKWNTGFAVAQLATTQPDSFWEWNPHWQRTARSCRERS